MTIRRDPFETMDRMFEQMRRSMMGERLGMPPAFEPASGISGSEESLAFSSQDANLRMESTEDGYIVMADLPGFEKDEITVRFEDGLLTIAADSEATDEDEFAVRRHSRQVRDELRLPATIREDEIEATYHNGVLEVTLPTEEDVTDDDEHVIDVK